MTSPINNYIYDGKELEVTSAMKKDYEKDGFIIVRNLLSAEEINILEVSSTCCYQSEWINKRDQL